MADTAHKSKSEYKEYIDSPEVLKSKVDTLVAWIRDSTHFTAFTGAGISTSAGVKDFRTGLSTVLDVGAGAWTIKAAQKKGVRVSRAKKAVGTLSAVPTPTHMAIVALQRAGVLKFLVSQNTDGLHRRSGFPASHLSELHGNSNLERCATCGWESLHDTKVRTAKKVHSHRTGRRCPCGGHMRDSIINFGEDLPEKPLEDAFDHARRSDVCLVMGSSLRVTPAAGVPEKAARRGRLVIVNLQKTPLDSVAALRINAKCDDVMRLAMEGLGLGIEPFKLRRYLEVGFKVDAGAVTAVANGRDADGTPFALFTKAGVELPSGYGRGGRACDLKASNPSTPSDMGARFRGLFPGRATFVLDFHGHYREPGLRYTTAVPAAPGTHTTMLEAVFDPVGGRWEAVAPRGGPETGEEEAGGEGKAAGAGAVTDAMAGLSV